MTNSRASRNGPPGRLLERLERELADVARQIATLLTQPRYEEAELAELDARAKELREQIDALKAPARQAICDGRSPLVSG
jgi:hypothetical protein